MPVTPLDILIAHKAINLSTSLSNSDKQVAGILLDHFNRRTAQCDPSLESVADLASMSRRTVMRSVGRLERQGFFRKVRHGGKFHRNMYEPVWSAFREAEAQWGVRRKNRRNVSDSSKVSLLQGPPCHLDGDSDGHQTCSNNLSQETLVAAAPRIKTLQQPANGRKRSGEKANAALTPSFRDYRPPSSSARSSVASRDAAERRWNNDLLRTYGSEPDLLGRVVDAIDADLMLSVTDTELRRSGSGLTYLIAKLQARDSVMRSLGIAPAAAVRRGATDA